MSPTHVELYEALKPTVGAEAARMIAEVVPPAVDVATKSDIESLRGEIHAESSRTIKWMLGFFIPVWAGTWATVIAVIVKL